MVVLDNEVSLLSGRECAWAAIRYALKSVDFDALKQLLVLSILVFKTKQEFEVVEISIDLVLELINQGRIIYEFVAIGTVSTEMPLRAFVSFLYDRITAFVRAKPMLHARSSITATLSAVIAISKLRPAKTGAATQVFLSSILNSLLGCNDNVWLGHSLIGVATLHLTFLVSMILVNDFIEVLACMRQATLHSRSISISGCEASTSSWRPRVRMICVSRDYLAFARRLLLCKDPK